MKLDEKHKTIFRDTMLFSDDVDKIDVAFIMSRYKHAISMEQWSLRESVALENRWLNLYKHCEDAAIFIMRRLKELNKEEFDADDMAIITLGESAMGRLMDKAGEFKVLATQVAVGDMRKLPKSKRGLWPGLL